MEPQPSPLHPQVPALLAKLGLRAVDAANWNVLLCVPADATDNVPAYALKYASTPAKSAVLDYEIGIIARVLPSVDRRLFERLEFPDYVNDGQDGGLRWMLSRHVPGRALIHEWSELDFKPEKLGGRRIPAATAQDAVDLLRDLRSVDIAGLPPTVRRFSFAEWLAAFPERSAELVAAGFMEPSTAQRAMDLFSQKRLERYEGTMFTNGDFYPRNFIMLEDARIAVTDWVGGVDPWEFVAMYAWMMMWGNPAWQVEYLDRIRRHFPVDVEEMRAGLLVRSFDRAHRWRDLPEESVGTARRQMMEYFREALDVDYVRRLFA